MGAASASARCGGGSRAHDSPASRWVKTDTVEINEIIRPKTRYARSGEARIAYQVIGDGPFDLIAVPGFVSNVEYLWEIPGVAAVLERFASYARLITWDKRGTGLSDPLLRLPPLEERMDDMLAVLDAAGSEQAALFGVSEGGPLSILFTATHRSGFRRS